MMAATRDIQTLLCTYAGRGCHWQIRGNVRHSLLPCTMTSSTKESALESEEDGLTHVAKLWKTLKHKRRATSPSWFGVGLEALLEMASGMLAPLSLKPGLGGQQKEEKLECGARKLLEGEKEWEEKGCIRDVIGGWGVEGEHALWKVVQRWGVCSR